MSVQVTDNSDIFLGASKEAIARAMEAIGLAAEAHAKAICPVDTGRLRNSISHAAQGNEAYIGTNVEYAAADENGTRRQRTQPYLKPAATEHGAEYREIVLKCLKDG